ncbi:tapasin isoform X2 [Chelonia mydas]|uniref:tapasin isoform X2 n=1 Tax=Chelonia mydas TaxID=8469 RepID=UPI0018A21029|nr:tapasin isoform X2 [Chelonia mydas]
MTSLVPVGALALLLPGFALCLALAGPPRLSCWFVEEAGGRMGVMPSSVTQRRALLLLRGARGGLPETEPELPPDLEPGMVFDIADPAGALHRVPLPAGGRSKEGELPSCEINAYTPQEAHVPWAAGLTPERRSPLGLGGPWFISSVQAPARDYGVSAVLKSEEAAMSQQPAVIMATAVLSVFSRTPHLHSRLGRDVLLDCGFTAPPGPFSVEWRYQYRGAGRVVLAYDGVSGRAHVAEEGAQLFLEEGRAGADTNVSLRLSQVGVRHEGTYICTIYLPHLHAQQALELRITEPPMVTLHPDPLSVAPGAPAELACEVSGYYPLDVTVSWLRRGPGEAGGDLLEYVTETWESGHRHGPDGTYSLSSFARLAPVQPRDHGATYSCHVTHAALATPARRSVRLRVAGATGPSLEDAIGMFLAAFLLYGLFRLLGNKVCPSGAEEKSKKSE